jgi:hypothetical protein
MVIKHFKSKGNHKSQTTLATEFDNVKNKLKNKLRSYA